MEAGERPRIRRRRWPRARGVLFALVAAGALVLAYFLQPAQLTALILSRAGSSLRLELHTSGPGNYAWTPELRFVLPGLTARTPGSATPFFRSARFEVALPWKTLLGHGSEIGNVALESPDLDLQGLNSWLATLPPSNAPFKLPTLLRGLQVADGTLRSTDWQIERLNLELPSLADGRTTTMDANGVLALASISSRFDLHTSATAAGVGHGLRIDDARVALKADGELPSLTAEGSLLLADTIALDLHGIFQQMPAAWSDATDSSFATSGDTPFSIAMRKGPPKRDLAHPLESLTARHGYRLNLALGDATRQPSLALDAEATTGAILDARAQGRISRWPDAWPGLPTTLTANTAPIQFEASYQGPVFLSEPFVYAIQRGDAAVQGNAKIADLRAWIHGELTSIASPALAPPDEPAIDADVARLRGAHTKTKASDDAPSQTAPASAIVPRS